MAIPPNYRDAENPRESCKTCAYFRPRGTWCEMFNVLVSPEKTCDKWTDTRSEVSMESEVRRTVSTAEREKLASKGAAMPDGSYPIANVGDLKNAIQAIGRAKNPGAVKAHIKRRAAALGRSDLIPDNWRSEQLGLEDRAGGFEPGEPDADDLGGPSDEDADEGGDRCIMCGGSGQTDLGMCSECQGTGAPKIEGLVGGQSFNSASARLKGTTERRSFTTEGAELRSTSDGGLRFSGYASITETPYEVAGFEETFARGAFKRCLNDSPDVCLLINHEGLPLARTSSGTLTLTEDSRGLRVDADLDPKDPDVASLAPKMRRGDLTEMSFAFRALEDEWSENDTKRLVRSATIHRGDVSVVTRGANTNTTATIRSVIEEMEQRSGKPVSEQTQQKLEQLKREAEALIAEPVDEEPEQRKDSGVELMKAQLEVARARRARHGRRTA